MNIELEIIVRASYEKFIDEGDDLPAKITCFCSLCGEAVKSMDVPNIFDLEDPVEMVEKYFKTEVEAHVCHQL